MDHIDLIRRITAGVRDAGAVATLDHLRRTRPAMSAGGGHVVAYHDTCAVFFVWAVERLVDAGLSDAGILWHPLTDVRSPLSWWDDVTLAGDEAVAAFVPATEARPGEPTPTEPTRPSGEREMGERLVAA